MKKIFVSRVISDDIDRSEDLFPDIDIVNELDDMEEDVSHFLTLQSEGPLFIMLFIHITEHDKVYSFVKGFKPSDLSFKIIVLDPENRFHPTNNARLESIAHLRTSRILKNEFIFLVSRSFAQMETRFAQKVEMDKRQIQLEDTKHDQEDLINIGKSLSLEKDPDRLLKTILFLSKRITGADAGSIYLIEEPTPGKRQIRFKYSHTFSKDIPLVEFVIPHDTNSIAGYVAITGNVLNLPDVYNLSPSDPVSFNSSVDETHSYRSKSMLVVPMRNHNDEVIGVIQLINSKEDIDSIGEITGNEAFEIKLNTPDDFLTKVVAFDRRYEELMESVASQAAIAIENNRMMRQIETQFEEFVKASVHAIESRDVATSGHSFRVSEICTEMARAINRERDGKYASVSFSENEIKELEYAALLHDFGKVYIDVAIFMKGKKLFPKDFANLLLKFNYLYKMVETRNMQNIHGHSTEKISDELEKSNRQVHSDDGIEKLNSIKQIINEIRLLNEPTVTDRDPEEIIRDIDIEIKDISCIDIEGSHIDVLTDDEKANLGIKRGSLNALERKEIESHVEHTYNFVSKIPWPPEFRNIPDITRMHHEKLDGTGYPNGISGDDILIQARMMVIADIYDALVASDRPYKKAMPLEKALSILREEAGHNKLDKDLLEIFEKYKIYEIFDKKAVPMNHERLTDES